jgi:hypothetical protein
VSTSTASATSLLATAALLTTALVTPGTSVAAVAAATRCAAVASAVRPAEDAAAGNSTTVAGYVVAAKKAGTFLGVSSTWTVPKVKTAKDGNQDALDWAGVDGLQVPGYDPASLAQIGTASENENGKACYFAWWETPTKASIKAGKEHQNEIEGFAIHAGDEVGASVDKVNKKNEWVLSIEDLTTKKSFTKTVSYVTPGLEAEAVLERPTVSHVIAKLAATGAVTFKGVAASIAPLGYPSPLGNIGSLGTLYRLRMVNHYGKGEAPIAVPSTFTNGLCFTVADGSKEPAPPTQKACPPAG